MGKKVPKHYEPAFILPPLRAKPKYTRHFSKRFFPNQEWEGQGRRSGWGALLKQKLPLSVNISGDWTSNIDNHDGSAIVTIVIMVIAMKLKKRPWCC